MSVQILLDRSDEPGSGIFAADERVTGHVIYVAEAQETLESASIAFKGFGRISFPGDDHRRDETTKFFREEMRLFSGPFTVQQQTFTWPFEFVFPTSGPGGSMQLPPSTTIHGDIHIGTSPAFDIHIVYELHAKVHNSSLVHLHKEATKNLSFGPISLTPPPEPQMQQCLFPLVEWQSRKLPHEHHSLKQKMHHVFTLDPELRNPSINFNATVFLPDIFAMGRSGPVSFSLQQIIKGPTDPQEPTLVLQSLSLCLLSTTIRQDQWFGTTADETTAGDTRTLHPNALLPLSNEPITVASDVGLENFLYRNRFTPDFDCAAPSIKLTHSIKVHAEIEHEESGHVFEIKCKHPIVVLPLHRPGYGMSQINGEDEMTVPSPAYLG